MRFLLALSFLTALPVPAVPIVTEEDLGHSTRWFPAVGAVIGSFLWILYGLGSPVLPGSAASVLTLALWVLITRGLHLDGLADTFDGLGGGGGRKRALEIMKDSRIGTFGALAVFMVMAMKISLLASLGKEGSVVLFLSPVLGRWSLVLSIRLFRPARPDGMGRRFAGYCGFPELFFASALALIFVLFSLWRGLALFLTAALTTVFTGLCISSKLGGVTGDSYGCICELTETAVLLAGSLLYGSGV